MVIAISGMRYYNPTTGRWISRDPIGEKGGIGLYVFLQNNSIGTIDLLGLSDYDYLIIDELSNGKGPFVTVTSAIISVLEKLARASFSPIEDIDQFEYGGAVYQRGDSFFIGKICKGRNRVEDGVLRKSVKIAGSPFLTKEAATFHTHPDLENINLATRFSTADILAATLRKVPSYIIAPNGEIRVWDPEKHAPTDSKGDLVFISKPIRDLFSPGFHNELF